uniref:3-deoxy-D-manno-octulosonic acid kinase n=1 Tax=Ningiella ruwaisensis TaxID=2364274 RepID=UPI00109F5093|nr:3-deoxy-D-manno-octulosonic acid kinase [Ningiella ruwaisensis]
MSIDVQTSPDKVSLLRTELGMSLHLGLKHFDLEYLQSKNAITHTAAGRGKVYFFRHADKELVLRHYYRGGLVGKINKDHFIYTGIFQTRAFKELQILDFLNDQDINVPHPVAARIERFGFSYRADIITEVVADAQELHEMLKMHTVDDGLWVEIGKTLGKLHRLKVRHDDINVKNILVQGGKKIVLIDFDKCSRQAYGNWQSANLARFYRSLIKQSKGHQPYYFTQSNWESLQAGYAEITS